MYDFIKTDAQNLKDELTALRREFHHFAEPGWLEMRTASRIARELKNMGYEELILGRDVCQEDSRMGVPSDETLRDHYAWAEENGADLTAAPVFSSYLRYMIPFAHTILRQSNMRCRKAHDWRAASSPSGQGRHSTESTPS